MNVKRTIAGIVVSCGPAFFVWANVWRTRGEFDDNSFTLYPDEPRTVTFTPKDPGLTLNAFRRAFSVTHLRETYK